MYYIASCNTTLFKDAIFRDINDIFESGIFISLISDSSMNFNKR